MSSNPTHICVWPNGRFYDRDTVSLAIDSTGPMPVREGYATLRVRPGQDPADVAFQHLKAEQRYFSTLHL